MRPGGLCENVHEILGIRAKPGTEMQLFRDLECASEVAKVYISFGEYDLIALLNIEDSEKLSHFIDEKMSSRKGVVAAHITLVKNCH